MLVVGAGEVDLPLQEAIDLLLQKEQPLVELFLLGTRQFGQLRVMLEGASES